MKILNRVLVMVLVFSFGLGLLGLSEQVTFAAGPVAINLGSSSNFVILAKTGISTTGATSVVGDIGVSPAAATSITGFALTLPAASAFSTSAAVNGKAYAPGYADPTPANMTTAVSNMETAYTDAMGRTNPTATELGAGNIGGLTIAPGLYKWGTGVTIPADVTLSGSGSDVWIFQIAQNLDISSGKKIILSGGAQASNIFWAVAGQTTLGTTSVFNGNILGQTAIVLNTGASLTGRALAQTAVTLDSNSVTIPVAVVTTPTPPATSSSSNSSSNISVTPAPSTSSGATTTTTPATPATPAVPATSVEGCVSGNLFSATSGRSCTVSATPAVPATPAKYNFGLVTLRSGSRGEAVIELQRFLNARLNLGLVLDGKLGPKTIAVIKKWQMENGLVVDGLIGVKTKARMNASVQ